MFDRAWLDSTICRAIAFVLTIGCFAVDPQPALSDPTSATTPATAQSGLAITTTATTTQPAVSPGILQLIDQLNADDWRSRQSAEDRLVAIGESVRGPVSQVCLNGSPEQRTRGPAILARLDVALANRPTLITLHMKNANPHDVFAEIGRQAAIDVGFSPPNLWGKLRGVPFSPVNIDLDQQPFWAAVAQVSQLTATRMQMMNFGNGNKLTVCQSNPGEDWLAGPRSDQGQFIVMPERIDRNQSIAFSPAPLKTSTSAIQLKLLVDPKVTVTRVVYRAKLTQATDDKGHSLLPPDDGPAFRGFQGFQEGPGLTFELNSPLVFPENAGSKLSCLKGIISVLVASQMEHLDLPDVTTFINQPKLVGRWTVTLESCQIGEKDGSYALKVSVPERILDPNSLFSAIGQIRLVDSAGQTISTGYNSGSGDGLRYEIKKNFTFPEMIHPPVSLKWDLPMETKEKQVRFEFTDLPLPTP
jgi:hypothetical protein